MVAKIEWYPGQLVPTVSFIVISLNRPAEQVVTFYNQRNMAEWWIKETELVLRAVLRVRSDMTTPDSSTAVDLARRL